MEQLKWGIVTHTLFCIAFLTSDLGTCHAPCMSDYQYNQIYLPSPILCFPVFDDRGKIVNLVDFVRLEMLTDKQ